MTSFSKFKFLYRAYKYRFRNDKNELKYILKKVQKGNTVLDVGAHKGAYLYWLRKGVGKNGKVIAIEPQPILYEYLQQSIKEFGYKNIELINAGASLKKDTLQLYVPGEPGATSPGATFEKKEGDSHGYIVEVPVIPLNEILLHRKSKIDLIKVDVEGHEIKVFEGANEVLTKDKPKIIFECESRHLTGINIFDVFEHLKNLDYRGYFFKNATLTPIEEFDMNQFQTTRNGEIVSKKTYINNFVFEPNE